MKKDLTAEDVRDLFDYRDGELYWRSQRTTSGPPRKMGVPVGHVTNKGYIGVCIYRRHYKAHRVIWLHQMGAWPSDQIDHINGDKADNRIENLRDVTQAQNQWNRSFSGCWKKNNVFETAISVNGSKTYLGRFKTEAEAMAAYREAASTLRGEFGRA